MTLSSIISFGVCLTNGVLPQPNLTAHFTGAPIVHAILTSVLYLNVFLPIHPQFFSAEWYPRGSKIAKFSCSNKLTWVQDLSLARLYFFSPQMEYFWATLHGQSAKVMMWIFSASSCSLCFRISNMLRVSNWSVRDKHSEWPCAIIRLWLETGCTVSFSALTPSSSKLSARAD